MVVEFKVIGVRRSLIDQDRVLTGIFAKILDLLHVDLIVPVAPDPHLIRIFLLCDLALYFEVVSAAPISLEELDLGLHIWILDLR